jgi:uncharacterized protein YbaR (Trm112 family)
MEPDRKLLSEIDVNTLALLACPACYGELSLKDSRLICAGCGRAYLFEDGIPVLLIERAERADGGIEATEKGG